MKYILSTLLLLLSLSTRTFSQENGKSINLSSVDQFFKISKDIGSGKTIPKSTWDALFESPGYKVRFTSDFSREIIKKIAVYAFNPKYGHERDSILKISIIDNMSDNSKVLSNLTLINFLDMKLNFEVLEKFRGSYDFDVIKKLSKEKLHSFLKDPIDSLIVFPSVDLLCQEAEAQSKEKGIVIDFNLFYKQLATNENVDFMAHEMFHSYRAHFVDTNLVNRNSLMLEIDKLQNEGTADLIDKTLSSITKKLLMLGYPKSLVDLYVSTYENTPQKLKAMDSITCSFIHKEINEEEFNSQLKDFLMLGGHPNGFFMTSTIKEAGLVDQLIKNFYSPIEFIRIYNSAARKQGKYVLSNEFVAYISDSSPD